MQAFTRNYEDNSTDAGFQFTFYCDSCRDGFRSSFIESTSYKKGKLMRGVTQGAGALGSIFGGVAANIGYGLQRGGDVVSERFQGMTPEWHREHEGAFQRAQNEAMRFFHRCHNCRQYVCDSCYNDEAGLCASCAPRENVEIAAARAERIKQQIRETAQNADLFSGRIEKKTTVCPACGKPSGEGVFCNNCGANLAVRACPKCGMKAAPGIRFCGGCGTKL